MQEPGEAILEFQTVLSERDNIDDLVAIYLLGSILNRTSNGQVVLPSKVGSKEASSHVPFVSCAVETLICFCLFRSLSVLPAVSLGIVRGWK